MAQWLAHLDKQAVTAAGLCCWGGQARRGRAAVEAGWRRGWRTWSLIASCLAQGPPITTRAPPAHPSYTHSPDHHMSLHKRNSCQSQNSLYTHTTVHSEWLWLWCRTKAQLIHKHRKIVTTVLFSVFLFHTWSCITKENKSESQWTRSRQVASKMVTMSFLRDSHHGPYNPGVVKHLQAWTEMVFKVSVHFCDCKHLVQDSWLKTD